VREALHGREHQRLAVVRGELAESASEGQDLDAGLLPGWGPHRAFDAFLQLHLDPDPLARDMRAEPVAQDRVEPRRQVGAWGELALSLERADDRVVHEIVGEVAVACGQAARERPQARHQLRDLPAEVIHDSPRSRFAAGQASPIARVGSGVGWVADKEPQVTPW
jgi:hypothetical protein